RSSCTPTEPKRWSQISSNDAAGSGLRRQRSSIHCDAAQGGFVCRYQGRRQLNVVEPLAVGLSVVEGPFHEIHEGAGARFVLLVLVAQEKRQRGDGITRCPRGIDDRCARVTLERGGRGSEGGCDGGRGGGDELPRLIAQGSHGDAVLASIGQLHVTDRSG